MCAFSKIIIYYNNSLTSSHCQIEKELKRKVNEQIQHWLLLLKIYHMMSCDHGSYEQ